MSNAETFARSWVDAWNRRDVEAVLAHYQDALEFVSARAVPITGAPLVQGKPALRSYWHQALAQITSLHFSLDRVIEDAHGVSLIYEAVIDGKRVRACEVMWFGAGGLITRGEAFYGAPLG